MVAGIEALAVLEMEHLDGAMVFASGTHLDVGGVGVGLGYGVESHLCVELLSCLIVVMLCC